nr:zf-HC2 domain-containing protein [Arthrobacter sp. PAMC25284]
MLGVYLLGGLEPDDAATFERHLAVCADCRRELDDLAVLPALLDAVPAADAVALTVAVPGRGPGSAAVPVEVPRRLLDELAVRRRHARHRWVAALGGAAAAALALGVLAGPVADPAGQTRRQLLRSVRRGAATQSRAGPQDLGNRAGR